MKNGLVCQEDFDHMLTPTVHKSLDRKTVSDYLLPSFCMSGGSADSGSYPKRR